jgi:hypothetical protein
MATWRFKVRGKQRKPVNRGMLVQALIELGRQMAQEAEAAQQAAEPTNPEEKRPDQEASS